MSIGSDFLSDERVEVGACVTLGCDDPYVIEQANFTRQTMPMSAQWRAVAYGNGVFVAIVTNSAIAATSPDGVTWAQRTLPVNTVWISVTYGNGLFVGVSYSSAIAGTSPDGITWTQRTLPVSANWYSVTYGNGLFVAITKGSTNVAATCTAGIGLLAFTPGLYIRVN